MGVAHAGDFAFAQPRLQARHAALLSADRWADLEQIGDFGQFLQSVRTTPLAPLVESFGALSSIDQIEITLRGAFTARTAELASWLPDGWQPAVLWVRALPETPFRRHVRIGEPQGWMADDPALAALLREETAEAEAAPAQSAERWLERWQALWPEESPGLAPVGRHLAAAALPDFGNEAAWPVRRAGLADRLRRAFRQQAFGPGGAFAHLGLVCLELGRLRGNLTARRALLIA